MTAHFEAGLAVVAVPLVVAAGFADLVLFVGSRG